jgi:DNA-binding CsgD family transcriptional regulator
MDLVEIDKDAAAAHRRGAPSSVVADHLLGAAPVDEPWAVSALEDAARQALREGRVEVAVRYLEAAEESCTDGPRRARITTSLVRAEWRINPSTAAGHLPRLGAALREGHLRTADALVLAKALLWHGRFTEAGAVLERAAPADPLIGVTYPSFRPLLSVAERRPSTVSGAQREEAADALVEALSKGLTEYRASTAERILHTTRLDETSLDTVESALLALTYGNRPDRAAPWCDRFVEEAGVRRAPSRQARLAGIRAEIAIRLGDLASARQHGRCALTLMPPSSWGVAVGGPLAALILAHTAAGEHGPVRDLLDQPVPPEMFRTRHGLHYLHARGRYSRAIGELNLALNDFRLCGALAIRWQLDAPGFLPWRVEVAETLLAMDRPEEASALAEEQLIRCGEDSPRVRAMALRLLAGSRPPRERLALLRQAAELHTGGDDYELARTLADTAAAYRENGEPRRAAMTARRARVRAAKAGARPLLRLLGGRDDDLGRPAIDPATLSEAEWRVAALAADGYSNREIARKLFVTVSTVEQHLTHTYRKLKVTRRTDLPVVVRVPAPRSR